LLIDTNSTTGFKISFKGIIVCAPYVGGYGYPVIRPGFSANYFAPISVSPGNLGGGWMRVKKLSNNFTSPYTNGNTNQQWL